MDERDFKRHLRDLAHGHHHPDEHDWAGSTPAGKPPRTRKASHGKSTGKRRKTARK